MAPRGRTGRRGESLVDHLLVFTLVVLAGVVAAYIWMPDLQRAVGSIADQLAHWAGFRPT